MSEIEYDDEGRQRVKVILIGNASVGKTNLIKVTTGGAFDENEEATLKVSYLEKKMKIGDKEYNLFLWDTIGNERLRSMTNLFFKNSKIVIFVYDITEKSSFDGIKDYWAPEVKNQIGDNIVKGLVGNKTDLYLKEKVKEEEAEEYAKSINAFFRTTSAKNEPKGLECFLEELLKEYNDHKEKYDSNTGNGVDISKPKKNESTCCLFKKKNSSNRSNGSN